MMNRFPFRSFATKKQWINRHLNDPYVRQAQDEAYRSRAAFKLLQLHQQYRIFPCTSSPTFVIDLGAAPGGWSQVAANASKSIKVIAVDLLDIAPINERVTVLKGDFTSPTIQLQLCELFQGRVPAVLSDMSPNITGIRNADHLASMELATAAWKFAEEHLSLEGSFIVKIFQGGREEEEFKRLLSASFDRVVWSKPDASRKSSAERYLVCLGRKKSLN